MLYIFYGPLVKDHVKLCYQGPSSINTKTLLSTVRPGWCADGLTAVFWFRLHFYQHSVTLL